MSLAYECVGLIDYGYARWQSWWLCQFVERYLCVCRHCSIVLCGWHEPILRNFQVYGVEIIAREAVEHCMNIMWNPLRDGGVASLLRWRLMTEHYRMYGIVFRCLTTMSSTSQRRDALWKVHSCTQIKICSLWTRVSTSLPACATLTVTFVGFSAAQVQNLIHCF
jgi:hypothetical protein